jgi:uncharacterized protein (TIGR04255 family)
MTKQLGPLPDFTNPPVAEVALSLQFETIEGLRTAHLGLLWGEFRATLPKVEEQAPLDTGVEEFDIRPVSAPRVRIEAFDAPPVPRLWFLDESGMELIQVQQDRFINNWRRVGQGVQYPRYHYIRDAFSERLDVFRNFLSREKLGDVVPTQCEITYVNHIDLAEGHESHGRAESVVTVWKNDYSDGFLPEAEDVGFRARYVIRGAEGEPLGRLHVTNQPAFKKVGEKPIFVLTLTARGKPLGGGLRGAYEFFELGHEWIVRGFASVTTRRMHEMWGRKDA